MSTDPEQSTGAPRGVADLRPLERRREQRAWSWYDWANSAFYTSVLTVLFAPYMITVAGRAAGCPDPDETCSRTVSLLGLDLAAGSLPAYLTTFATIASAFVLPVVGAFVDGSAHKKRHMAGFAWAGALAGSLLFFMEGDDWQLGAVAVVAASILGGCSLVSYYAILVDISTVEERDRVSSRGWAWGYLGGGLLLLLNLVVVLGHDAFGIGTELAVRLSMLSAALWWAGFTIVPFVRLRDHQPSPEAPSREGSLVQRSFGQLWTTMRELRGYPMTMTFLIAYLFYNDGIQTVIASASTYGSKQLGLSQTVLIATILMIQFVAFGGALLFGRLASTHGPTGAAVGHGRVDGHRRRRHRPARGRRRALRAHRRRHRGRHGRHPGAVALVLQHAHPPRPRGGVLRALQRRRAWHLVVRHAALRPGLPAHRLLPPAIFALLVFFCWASWCCCASTPGAASRRPATPCRPRCCGGRRPEGLTRRPGAAS